MELNNIGDDVQNLMKQITQSTLRITQNNKQIETFVQQFGTGKDSLSHREKTFSLIKTNNQLSKDTFKQIKQLSSHSQYISKDTQLKIQQDRLTDSYTRSLRQFQDIEKQVAQKPRFVDTSKNEATLINLENEQDTPFGVAYTNQQANNFEQQQRQQQIDNENLRAIQEQNEAMRDLERNIVDVNSIFKDLAVLVHEQGDVIDSIEGNIENTHVTIKASSEQLKSAVKYQTKARRKKFILFMILLAVLLVVGLILFFSLYKFKK